MFYFIYFSIVGGNVNCCSLVIIYIKGNGLWLLFFKYFVIFLVFFYLLGS